MTHKHDALIALPLIGACIAIGITFPHLGADAILIPAFMLLFVMLPSFSLGRILLPHLNASPAEAMFLGYPAAITLFSILFWVGALVQLPHLPSAVLGLSAWAIWRLCRPGLSAIEPKVSWICTLFSATALATVIFYIIKTNPVPPSTGETLVLYKDFSILTADISALVRFLDSPPVILDPFLSGLSIGYHFLQFFVPAYYDYIFYSFPYNNLVFIAPLFGMFFLVGALFVGATKLASLQLSHASILAFLILFTSGTGPYWYGYQLYWATFTFFFSLPFFFMFLFYCVHVLSQDNNSRPVYASLLYLGAGAAKGPLAAVLPIALSPIMVWKFWSRNISFKDILSGVGIVLSAIVLKYTLYNAAFRHVVTEHSFVSGIVWACELIAKLLATPECALIIVFLLCDRIFRIRMVRHRQFASVLIGVVAACGIVPYVLGYDADVLYYLWYGRIVVLYAVSFAIAYAFQRRNIWQMTFSAAVIAIGIYFMLQFQPFFQTTSTNPATGAGIPSETLTGDEWVALSWLRKNAPRDSVFITNRFSDSPVHKLADISFKDQPFYHYAGFSGLRSYLATILREGGERGRIQQEHIERLLAFLEAADPEAASRALALIPADYFIQCLRFDQRDYSRTEGLSEVYRNGSMILYQITPPARSKGQRSGDGTP